MTSSERKLEEELISKLRELKYAYREDIRDRATLLPHA
jgi:type I restriction enzyme R subunit